MIVPQFLKGLPQILEKIVDSVVTSKEEAANVKIKFQKAVFRAQGDLDKEISRRWESDERARSWMSRNIRPLLLLLTFISMTILSIMDSGVLVDFNIKDQYIKMYGDLLTTMVWAYYGGNVAKTLIRSDVIKSLTEKPRRNKRQ